MQNPRQQPAVRIRRTPGSLLEGPGVRESGSPGRRLKKAIRQFATTSPGATLSGSSSVSSDLQNSVEVNHGFLSSRAASLCQVQGSSSHWSSSHHFLDKT